MKQDHRSFPHRPISFRMVILLIVISGASVIFQWAIGYAISKWFPMSAANTQSQSTRIAKQLTLSYTVGAMTFWVIEELIFRGLILQFLRRHLPLWAAVLITSLLFAAEHLPGGAPTVEMAFVYSIYLAWVMIRTDSIYAPIVAHWAVDFSILYVFLPLRGITAIAAQGQVPPAELFLFPWYAYVLAGAVMVIGVTGLRKEFRRAAMDRDRSDVATQV